MTHEFFELLTMANDGQLIRPTTEKQMKKLKPLSWKAKRHGAIYCAPACGRGCTWKEYQSATINALKLARRMGKGWKIRLHENLGWHYHVISPCGRIKITGKELGTYSAFLGDKKETFCMGTWVEHGNTPEQAMALVIKKARTQLDKISAALSGF